MDVKKVFSEYLIGIVLLLGVGAGLYLNWSRTGTENDPSGAGGMDNPMGEQVTLMVGGAELLVEVRNTEEDREMGLSGRESLGEDEGMLFVYETAVTPTFWMKDMRFDLDMIWIREGIVLGVSENLPAPTNENKRIRTAKPNQEIDMVLEVPSGWVKRNEVKAGDVVKLSGN